MNHPNTFLPRIFLAVCFVLSSFSIGHAAPPAEELLGLVPSDAGFCLVVRDFREHRQRLASSPFVEQLKNSFLGQSLRASPEFRTLQAFDRQLQTQFNTSLSQLGDDILGDAVVLAYWPGSPGKPETERGLLLTNARDPALLASLANRLNEIQRESGQLARLETRKRQGVSYVCRIQKTGGAHYYLIRGGLLALSTDEATLHRVIDAALAENPENNLARRFGEMGGSDALATLWINPRAFDAEIQRLAKQLPEPLTTILGKFFSYWKELEGVGLSVRLHDAIEVDLCIRMKTDRLPAAAQRLLAQANQPSSLWTRFPDKTILTCAGRVDLAALLEVLADFLPAAERERMRTGFNQTTLALFGRDGEKDLLPNLGPDWGFYIAAPPANDKAWFPHMVFAIQVQSKPGEKPLDQSLFESLRTLAGLTTLSGGDSGMTLKTEKQGDVQVVSLANEKRFPPGLQPAFAIKDSCLVIASSPAAIRSFGETKKGKAPAVSGPEVPLARLSVGELRTYLTQRRATLVNSLAPMHGLSLEETSARFDRLLSVLELFEQADVVQKTTPNQVHLTLRLQPTKPLKRND